MGFDIKNLLGFLPNITFQVVDFWHKMQTESLQSQKITVAMCLKTSLFIAGAISAAKLFKVAQKRLLTHSF